MLPVMRLTIDSWGIREIERLAESPEFGRRRTDDLVFVVLSHQILEGINAYVKFGILRLEVPEKYHGLQTWDTPTPPDLHQCHFYPAKITNSTRFRTIDLDQTTGITFFFSNDQIYAVHAHTRTTPYAQVTYQRLPHRRQQSVTWIYVPFAQRDTVVAIGSRMPSSGATFSSTCLLFRMKLGGDVSVGVGLSEEVRDVLLSKAPTTLIYNELESQPVSVFGACPTEVEEDSRPATPFSQPLIDDAPFPYAYFSLAPLERVNRARIFNAELTGFCVGILFDTKTALSDHLGNAE
ncbi:hypothetical protein BKA59DRAFT_515886 [Fusarium tricinctum]|uniref:Uncharacterized protein n=1 Tax=Fusarium tricinctum TaxID=61284 RepID=A0A8K0RQP7_9HYPO|nr:hypothetical protein BKA59DRAFT_515886 [Fusarium tricinctum]